MTPLAEELNRILTNQRGPLEGNRLTIEGLSGPFDVGLSKGWEPPWTENERYNQALDLFEPGHAAHRDALAGGCPLFSVAM